MTASPLSPSIRAGRLLTETSPTLTLFHYEGLSQVEVGRIMGISDEAVESLLARARRHLKDGLREEWRELLAEDEQT